MDIPIKTTPPSPPPLSPWQPHSTSWMLTFLRSFSLSNQIWIISICCYGLTLQTFLLAESCNKFQQKNISLRANLLLLLDQFFYIVLPSSSLNSASGLHLILRQVAYRFQLSELISRTFWPRWVSMGALWAWHRDSPPCFSPVPCSASPGLPASPLLSADWSASASACHLLWKQHTLKLLPDKRCTGVLRPCISESILYLYSHLISNLASSKILYWNFWFLFFRILKAFVMTFQFVVEKSKAILTFDLLDVTISLLEAWEIFYTLMLWNLTIMCLVCIYF